jgi:tripartite-type tricarboxylate transporter receptor subunit TctC
VKQKQFISLFCWMSVICCMAFAPAAVAAEYPDKFLEFVVHSPGGGADTFVRATALFLNQEGIVKPKIQVFNRAGGAGTVAINYLADNKGNPNVLMGWTTAPIVTILRGTTKVKDPTEMAFLCALAEDPNLLVVSAESRWKNLKDLIEDTRKNPDKIKGGVGSIGGTEHVIMNRVEKVTGVKFNITSFSAMAYIQILGGHIDFTFATPVDVMQHVKAGKLRILAAAGDTRTQFAPDVPTMKEQGVNTAFRQLRGFWGPPEMPDYAVNFWERAFSKLSETTGFKDHLKKMEMDPMYMGREQLRKIIPDYNKALVADLKDLEVYGGKKN